MNPTPIEKLIISIEGVQAYMEIMVYPGILVTRKYFSSQKIYDEITAVLLFFCEIKLLKDIVILVILVWHISSYHREIAVVTFLKFFSLWNPIAAKNTFKRCHDYRTLTEILCPITQDTRKARIISRSGLYRHYTCFVYSWPLLVVIMEIEDKFPQFP